MREGIIRVRNHKVTERRLANGTLKRGEFALMGASLAPFSFSTMKYPLLSLLALLPASFVSAADFKRDIMPILKAECYKCHSEESGKEKGGFVFDNLDRFKKDIGPGKVIEPGKVDGSDFITTFTNDIEEDTHMPPKKNLSAAQIAKFKEWIAEGATFDGSKVAAVPTAPAATPPPAAPASAVAMQNWTNTEGKTIQATMLRLEGETVVLQMSNGQTYNYPLSKLSAESQALAKNGGK
jgi:hypothetical protein